MNPRSTKHPVLSQARFPDSATPLHFILEPGRLAPGSLWASLISSRMIALISGSITFNNIFAISLTVFSFITSLNGANLFITISPLKSLWGDSNPQQLAILTLLAVFHFQGIFSVYKASTNSKMASQAILLQVLGVPTDSPLYRNLFHNSFLWESSAAL